LQNIEIYSYWERKDNMAKYREIPCIYYTARGICTKGRAAIHKRYCQHCDKYRPRVKTCSINKKRLYIEKIRGIDK